MRLYKAYTYEWMQYRDIYIDMGCNTEEVTAYAKQHSLWVQMLDCRYGKPKEFTPLAIHEAYKRVYPDAYSYGRMSHFYNKCLNEGIPSLLIKNYQKGNTYAKQFGKDHEAFVLSWMSSGKAYSMKYSKMHRGYLHELSENG